MAKATKSGKAVPHKAAVKAPARNNVSGVSAKTEASQKPVELTAPAPQPGQQPSLRILGQYLKDFSFENPNAPQSLAPQQNQPDINIAVNVNARNIGPNDFEVELHLDAKATGEGKMIFAAELLYAGIFKLENYPANILQAAVLIECPRFLFPFARQILADATRNGGFPPLMLDPIDFVAMYQRRLATQQQGQAQA
jgi:preprotein translocase subunit SecB